MMQNNLEELYFSASALKTYGDCHLKFKKRYLEGLYWPTSWNFSPEKQAKIKQGEDFHLLAAKYYSRGKLDSQDLISDKIKGWLEALVEFRPYNKQDKFYPEQELRFNDGQLKLMAKYDLLYKTEQQLIIYDWKTGSTKPKLEYWSNNIQTLLYRYLLVKASGKNRLLGRVAPEDLSLLYWNPNFPKQYQPLSYSKWQFERDGERIKSLISEIKQLDDDQFYATDNQKHCSYCEYRPICHGKDPLELDLEEDDLDLDFEWEELNMVEF